MKHTTSHNYLLLTIILNVTESNFPDFNSLTIVIELTGGKDFGFDMSWDRPYEHEIDIEIADDETFGDDDFAPAGLKRNKCIKYKRKQRADS